MASDCWLPVSTSSCFALVTVDGNDPFVLSSYQACFLGLAEVSIAFPFVEDSEPLNLLEARLRIENSDRTLPIRASNGLLPRTIGPSVGRQAVMMDAFASIIAHKSLLWFKTAEGQYWFPIHKVLSYRASDCRLILCRWVTTGHNIGEWLRQWDNCAKLDLSYERVVTEHTSLRAGKLQQPRFSSLVSDSSSWWKALEAPEWRCLRRYR